MRTSSRALRWNLWVRDMRAFGCVPTEGQIEMDGEVLQEKK